MDRPIYCTLKHILSQRDAEQIVTNIKTFVKPKIFDASGIKESGIDGKDTVTFQVTRDEANRIRDQFTKILPRENSPLWFCIHSEPLDSLLQPSLITIRDIHYKDSTFQATCRFGSLLSHNHFYSHVHFNNKIVQISFKPERQSPDSLYIEFDNISIVIPCKSIQNQNILVNKEDLRNGVYVILSLKYSPSIFRIKEVRNQNKSHPISEKRFRLCVDEQNIPFMRDIAKCSDVMFHFQPSPDIPWMFLRHFLLDEIEKYRINFSCFKLSNWPAQSNDIPKPDPLDYPNSSFQDRYGLQMLISLGYIFQDKWVHLNDVDLKWNLLDPSERYDLCCFAIEKLKQDHGYDLTQSLNDYRQSKKSLEKSDKNDDQQEKLIDNKQRLTVACCTLTPLKTVFEPLETTIGSRVLRNVEFGGPERFLLVHFRDEDNQPLRASNVNIKQRLKNSMQNGIELFNKQFQYFGASTSQMKEMAFWFIDLPHYFKDITEAHKKLGNLAKIKNIASYIARVGQYFSTTWPVDIQLTQVNTTSDILRNGNSYYVSTINDIERNNYCFTDGIGKISLGLAGRIAQRMNIPLFCQEDIPSAFQVRVAGCKGMIAIDPISTLHDYYIHIRKSMEKFNSDDWTLEICDYARPIPLTLNNQVIRLLSDLGNPDGQFFNLQNRVFNTSWQVPEEQQPSAIDIVIQRNISYSFLKHNLIKNRIPIPPEDGRCLFGVADETGTLQYGECFIQYSILNTRNQNQPKYEVVQGPILVTKNPCLWPGDFRRLIAVRNSTLEKCMRDVIVFPINGPRPHPNEIAGSDLDGDQYWVYWGDQFKIERYVEPLSYKGANKLETPFITTEKIIDHIIESFNAGIILGMIANIHTVVADKHPEHSFSEPCKQLAELFSLAVDSQKTGHFINKDQIKLYQMEYCKDWPRYMRKFDEPTYDSQSILAKLFNKAERKYYEMKQNPIINKSQLQTGPTKGASASLVIDKEFEKWLQGIVYSRKNILPTPVGILRHKNDSRLGESVVRNTVRGRSPALKDRNAPLKAGTCIEKRPHSMSNAGASTSEVNILQNPILREPPKKVRASSTSRHVDVSSALASLSIGEPRTYFILAIDTWTSATTPIQCTPINDKNLYTVETHNQTTKSANSNQVKRKIKLFMEKKDVFKKMISTHLVVFYGHLYFIKNGPYPKDIGDLLQIMKESDGQCIRFNHTAINELTMQEISHPTTKKDKIEYEFDYCIQLSPSEYYTLRFDNKKNLQQIRTYRLWSKYFVRQPCFNTDNLYEIRTTLTHEMNSQEFNRIMKLTFNSASTKLLTDKKPHLKIDRSILHPSVIPMALKILDEDREPYIKNSLMESFYRIVRYVSIEETQEKPEVLATLEYHASPMNKDDIDQICDIACCPFK